MPRAARWSRDCGGREDGLAELGRVALRRFTLAAACSIGALAGMAALVSLGLPHGLLRITAILASSLLAVRLVIYLLKHVLQPGPLLAASEHAITWVIWTLVAFALLGWLEPLGAALDAVAFSIGSARFSLLDAVQALFTLLGFLLAAAYVGGLLERRLMAASELSIGMRVGVAKTLRFGLVLLAVLLAFNLIGDRSIRPGDVITIDERFGVVKELRARYIVVHDRDGVDTPIPNENIITSQVINWS